ncbi:hypothetical protein [Nocardia testacea]|uniref:hypothetical protein n=1 Tax=Nocardia testacea TaxID=248551 RepID=UPI003A89B595
MGHYPTVHASECGAAGRRVFGTDKPNQWVAVHRGHHFHLSKRVGGNDSFDFEALDRRIDEPEELEHDGRRFRLRGAWLDEAKGGGFTWYADADCIMPFGEPLPDASAIRRFLRDEWTREVGQAHHFDIAAHAINWRRGHFDMDHYNYSERLPSFV